jgi:hypothetical protein
LGTCPNTEPPSNFKTPSLSILAAVDIIWVFDTS